jgi:hypothetical protein
MFYGILILVNFILEAGKNHHHIIVIIKVIIMQMDMAYNINQKVNKLFILEYLYEGEFSDGKKHGYGSLQIYNGESYKGYF